MRWSNPMAKRKSGVENTLPQTLENHMFYGLDVSDPEQTVYKDALWDQDVKVVIVDAPAGSGKTTLAIAMACMYVRYGRCEEALYIRTPSSEGRMGFLPGDIADKEKPYMQPLYSTLRKIGENVNIVNDGINVVKKQGEAFFTPMTDVYILGSDYSKKFIIIDEAQCMTTEQLKAILTRCHDDCKIVCIGSSRQIQGIKQEQSGLSRLIEHFSEKPWVKVCHLTKNYRGEVSAWADLL